MLQNGAWMGTSDLPSPEPLSPEMPGPCLASQKHLLVTLPCTSDRRLLAPLPRLLALTGHHVTPPRPFLNSCCSQQPKL